MIKCFYILFLLVVLLNKAYTQEPDIPLLDSVSVADPLTGSVYISWFPCDSPDVAKYIIFREINMNWEAIDTVLAPSTFYIDNGGNYPPIAANYHPELYRISAIDSAGNSSPMTLTSPIDMHHNTMYVFPYLDSVNCKMAIKLKWNKYVYWSENVNHYTIYVNINSTTWDSLSSVDGNSSEFYHQSITDNTYYCYFIRAVSNSGRTSTSNQTCFYTNLPDFPSFINADYASVTTAQRIEISFTLDTSAIVIKNYILYRSDSEFGSYLQIASYNNYTALNLIYTDNVDVTKNWYYKLAAIDQCGNSVIESNLARNISVNVTSNDDLTEFIKWDTYFNWLGGVEIYNIYRIVDDSSPMLISSTVIDTFFTDALSDYAVNRTGVSGKFCYYIEAIETDSNPYGIKGKSNSNVVCLTQPPIVYIPNSFTPNGDNHNDTLYVYGKYIKTMQFSIFDRWGFKIFETNNQLKGWDGKINGRKVPAGTYVYKLSYLEANNEIKEKTGLVYLFYP